MEGQQLIATEASGRGKARAFQEKTTLHKGGEEAIEATVGSDDNGRPILHESLNKNQMQWSSTKLAGQKRGPVEVPLAEAVEEEEAEFKKEEAIDTEMTQPKQEATLAVLKSGEMKDKEN